MAVYMPSAQKCMICKKKRKIFALFWLGDDIIFLCKDCIEKVKKFIYGK